jgi:trk system potassium uptake protein TrkH
LLSIRFIPTFGLGKGLWYSLFHSISAFCNAGFDLMGTTHGAYTSLIAYADDPLVNLVICALITVGGLGYWVWQDLWRNRFHWKRYRLHTKLVLTVSAALTVGGTVLFWLLEREHLADVSPMGQFLRSLFNAVTPRTAGFSTTDAATLTDGSKLLTVLYMFVGGSAGSTAGGIKTTTIAVILMCAFTEMTHRRDTAAFGRRLEANALQRAAAIAANNAALALSAALLLSFLHPSLGMMDILIETFSAIGTVGMSTGITRALGGVSRAALVLLMYCGRVGSLSFSIALLERRSRPPVTHPCEHIIIG